MFTAAPWTVVLISGLTEGHHSAHRDMMAYPFGGESIHSERLFVSNPSHYDPVNIFWFYMSSDPAFVFPPI
jgi:hypothetical protein